MVLTHLILQKVWENYTLEMVMYYVNLASNYIVIKHQVFSLLGHLNLGNL